MNQAVRATSALQAVREIASALAGVVEPAHICRVAARRLGAVLEADLACVWELSEDGRALNLRACNRPAGATADVASRIAVGAGLAGSAAATRRPVLWDDLGRGGPASPEWPAALGLRSGLAMPLEADGRLIGVVTLGARAPHRFHAAEEELVSTLAVLVATALRSATLAARTLASAERLRSALHAHTAVQDRTLDFQEMATVITADTMRLAGGEAAGIGVIDGDAIEWLATAGDTQSLQGVRIPLAGTLAGAAVRSGRPVVDGDVTEGHEAVDREVTAAVRSVIHAPIRHGGETIGILSVSSRRPDAFDADDVAGVELLAGVAGWAAVHARRYEELQAARRRIESVLASARLIVYALDADGIFRLSEGRGLEALGVRAGDRVGKSVFEVYPDNPEVIRGFQDALAGNSGDVLIQNGDVYLETRYEPMRDEEGRVCGVTGVGIDVTELIRSVRESEEKSRFLANMSHELRTPLNSILGFAQLLQSTAVGGLDDRQRRYVANIQTSGTHLLRLVNDVLDLAKVAAGQLMLAPERVAVRRQLAPLLERIEPLAEAKGLRLTMAAGREHFVLVDALRFDQVLLNLLSNAVKFTERGSVTVTAARADGMVVVTVADTGPGIAPASLDDIFQEFVQLDTGRTRLVEGTGLGLPLARRLARLMGGTLSVESVAGEGSRFSLSLPAARAGTPAAT